MKSRIHLLLLALAACALLVAGVAGAAGKRSTVTGGSTTVTTSPEAKAALAANGVTVAPIAPATASEDSVTLPISGGKLNKANLRGFVVHKGGIKFTKGSRSVSVRALVLNSATNHPYVIATVGRERFRCGSYRRNGHRHARYCYRAHRIVVANVVNAKKVDSGDANTVKATADLKLSRQAARAINHRFHKQVVKAGAPIGSAELTATTSG